MEGGEQCFRWRGGEQCFRCGLENTVQPTISSVLPQKDSSARSQALVKRVMRGTEDRWLTVLRCLRVEILEVAGTALLSSRPPIVPARQGRVERLTLDLYPSVLC